MVEFILPKKHNQETAVFVLVASLLMLVMTLPAFRTFFFAENLVYLGLYRAHGNDYWKTVFSPGAGIFVRPFFHAATLPWDFILPTDPWIYHVRNFVFSIINLLLLHRVLLRLVASRWARALALFFFAVSKVHLTTIGYINIYDSLLMLMTLLATILFLLRYIANKRPGDYILTLLFGLFSIFGKDYGFVIIGLGIVAVALYEVTPEEWRSRSRWWALRLAPLFLMFIAYLGLRYTIVDAPVMTNEVYSPRLSLQLTGRKFLDLTSTMGNFTLTDPGVVGNGGLGKWVSSAFPALQLGDRIEVLLYAGLMGLILVTFVIGRRAGWKLLFPAAWVVLYFAPTLLTRNQQIYYYHESLAGMAVLLGMCLDPARLGSPRGQHAWGGSGPLLKVWTLALVIVCINGMVSNYTSLYNWQGAAKMVQTMQKPVLEAHRGEHLDAITFVTASPPFWRWALTANYSAPLIPELMGLPALRVNVISYADLPNNQARTGEATLFFDIDRGFRELSGSTLSAKMNVGQQSFEKRKGTITADPNPVRVCDGSSLGITNVSYAFPQGALAEVHVDSPNGPLFAAPAANGKATTGKWVTDGMGFFLQDVSEGRPLTVENTLASVKVSLTNAGCQ